MRKDSLQAPKTAIKATVKLGSNVFFSLELNYLLLPLRGYNVFHQEPVPLSWNVTIDFENEKLQLKLYFSTSSILSEQYVIKKMFLV